MMSFLSTLSSSSISCIFTAVIIRCSQVLQDLPEHKDNWRVEDCLSTGITGEQRIARVIEKFYRTSILFVEFFTFV
jgi:hypothetical protein